MHIQHQNSASFNLLPFSNQSVVKHYPQSSYIIHSALKWRSYKHHICNSVWQAAFVYTIITGCLNNFSVTLSKQPDSLCFHSAVRLDNPHWRLAQSGPRITANGGAALDVSVISPATPPLTLPLPVTFHGYRRQWLSAPQIHSQQTKS